MSLDEHPRQLLAIDWSGAVSPAVQRRAIACARCDSATGDMTLTCGRLRAEVEEELTALGRAQARVVAGLDFSFSLPAWFLGETGCRSAPELWALAALEGEQWLQKPHPQFWGRVRGSGQPAAHRAPLWRGYRQCERAATGRLPASTFQIGGAGAPGTGSLRGMPMLARLRSAGWSIWPFDPPRLPLLVEIYPRLLTGPVIKSSAAARAAYLAAPLFAGLQPAVRAEAAACEDAFDALVSVVVMSDYAHTFADLRRADDPLTRLEGAFWQPGAPGGAAPGRASRVLH